MLFNKIDLLNKTQLAELKKHFPEKGNIRISIKNGVNLEEIKKAIMTNL
jgi:50S ribosomal subunit-associated GTPase HflX